MVRDDKGRFLKGISGNPKGRAKKVHEVKFLDLMRAEVKEEDWLTIIRTAIAFAKANDAIARKWLSDYLIGAPIQRQEVTGAEGAPLKILVEYADNNPDPGAPPSSAEADQ